MRELFKALQDKGIRDIVELAVTDRKASVQDFMVGWNRVYHAESAILIPHIDYLTNDSWEEVSGLTRTTGHPLLHSASYQPIFPTGRAFPTGNRTPGGR